MKNSVFSFFKFSSHLPGLYASGNIASGMAYEVTSKVNAELKFLHRKNKY